MTPVVRAMLEGLIDYAGLFPPAQLPLEEAWANYVKYRREPDAWMLGRFICPAARLGELAALIQARGDSNVVHLSVLGRGGKGPQEFLANVRADLADAAAFARQLDPRASLGVYEVRLPASAFQPPAKNQVSALAATTAFLIDREAGGPVALFFEAPAMEEGNVLALVEALHEDASSGEAGRRVRCKGPGLKIRCGGLEAAAFPSAALLGKAAAAAALVKLPLKATAGLHHPFRRCDEGLGTFMHGFVNLLTACLLARRQAGWQAAVEALADGRAEDFRVEGESLRWHGETFSAAEVRETRKELFTSFGSCSFDEPREDLREAGWI